MIDDDPEEGLPASRDDTVRHSGGAFLSPGSDHALAEGPHGTGFDACELDAGIQRGRARWGLVHASRSRSGWSEVLARHPYFRFHGTSPPLFRRGRGILLVCATLSLLFPGARQVVRAGEPSMAATTPGTWEWKKDKRMLVREQLALTAAESRHFWPIFERYQTEMERLAERRRKIIGEFGSLYDEMTGDAAKRLMLERLALEEQWIRLLRSYLPKFQRVLPDRKVARYYQIEMKLKAAVDCELAEELPLIK